MQDFTVTGTSPSHSSHLPRSILLIGPGWLGSEIAQRCLQHFDIVYTLSRSPARSLRNFEEYSRNDPKRWQHIQMDVRDLAHVDPPPDEAIPDHSGRDPARFKDSLKSVRNSLPAHVDAIVLCVAPTRERGDTTSSTYAAAAAGAVKLADTLNARTLVYTSSTGVYGAKDGAIVRESQLLDMHSVSDRQAALLEAEQSILGGPTMHRVKRFVLRLSGLYGPGRDPSKRFTKVDSLDPSTEHWCNFTWRDDAVSAVLHFISRGSEMLDDGCYNCADGHPVISTDISRALLHKQEPENARETAMAKHVKPVKHVTSAAVGDSRPSNQRVSIDKLSAAGWRPNVGTVFEGLRLLGHQIAE